MSLRGPETTVCPSGFPNRCKDPHLGTSNSLLWTEFEEAELCHWTTLEQPLVTDSFQTSGASQRSVQPPRLINGALYTD